MGNENIDSVLDADHVSIVKPRRPSDLNYLLFRRFCIGACPGVLERWRRKERTSGGVCEGRQDLLSFQRPGRQNGRRVRINKQTATKGRRISDEALLRCRRACPFERTRIELGTSRPGAKLQQELKKCQASHCLESDRSSNGLRKRIASSRSRRTWIARPKACWKSDMTGV